MVKKILIKLTLFTFIFSSIVGCKSNVEKAQDYISNKEYKTPMIFYSVWKTIINVMNAWFFGVNTVLSKIL